MGGGGDGGLQLPYQIRFFNIHSWLDPPVSLSPKSELTRCLQRSQWQFLINQIWSKVLQPSHHLHVEREQILIALIKLN